MKKSIKIFACVLAITSCVGVAGFFGVKMVKNGKSTSNIIFDKNIFTEKNHKMTVWFWEFFQKMRFYLSIF